jgi:hypothetical protein
MEASSTWRHKHRSSPGYSVRCSYLSGLQALDLRTVSDTYLLHAGAALQAQLLQRLHPPGRAHLAAAPCAGALIPANLAVVAQVAVACVGRSPRIPESQWHA